MHITHQPIAENRQLLGVITEDDLEALQQRNRVRASHAISAMGPRWCCHRVNSPTRQKPVFLRRMTDWPRLEDPRHVLPEPLRRLIRGER